LDWQLPRSSSQWRSDCAVLVSRSDSRELDETFAWGVILQIIQTKTHPPALLIWP